jgi:hypothetical protein
VLGGEVVMVGLCWVVGLPSSAQPTGLHGYIARGILPADWGGEVEVDESVCWEERL